MMSQRFRFRSQDTIGGADAESDQVFLHDCFVDTGEVERLLDCSDHRRIVLGRTGAGKTALLNQLAERTPGVIKISPESLALSYISNSTILQFVHGLGVNLDIFFKLLWRHVFTVEVLKAHFHLDGPDAKDSLINWLRGLFSDKKRQHEQALEYLERWGSKFWEQTDYRIRELTTTLESNLKASIGMEILPGKIGMSGGNTLSQEERAEVVSRAQIVVNEVQIQELSHVLDLLNAILDDPQQPYYLLIDGLDENWVEERLRYLLIRALIETVRDFRKVQHAKIIVALRFDLIDRVIRSSRSAGFQEEKYESLYLQLNWSKEQLIHVLDSRIHRLVKASYTTKVVTHADLLPRLVDGRPSLDYILDRTLMRPRDVIMFFNSCISQAVDQPQITVQMIRDAEGEYSRQRLRSLADEWVADYPELLTLVELLKESPARFAVRDVSLDKCLDVIVKLLSEYRDSATELGELLRGVETNTERAVEFRKWMIRVFYRVGLVGLKLESFEAVVWSVSGRRSVSMSEITDSTRVAVHPCFWRSLGIQPVSGGRRDRRRGRRSAQTS